MSKVSLNFIIKDKVRYFRFLLNKGFKISNASGFWESFGNWFVEFESPDCFLSILSDRDEVFVRIYPIKSDRKIAIGLEPMVFYLSGDRTFIGNYEGNLVWGTKKQLEQTSSLLEEYIDKIIPYMGREFQNIRNDYMLSGKRYMEIQRTTYRQKNRAS